MMPLSLLLLAFAGQAAAPDLESIPIWACIGIPPEESTPARYRQLADAGFTTSLTGFPNLAATLKALDAAHPCYVNLLPIYANPKQLGANTYKDDVDQFVSTVQPPESVAKGLPFLRALFQERQSATDRLIHLRRIDPVLGLWLPLESQKEEDPDHRRSPPITCSLQGSGRARG